jgi:biopolymer transport protein ExbB/TolQ
MSITERLLTFALLGSEWVLWLLILLSVLSVAVMVERYLSFRQRSPDLEALAPKLLRLLSQGDILGAKEALGVPRASAVRVGLAGIEELRGGRQVVLEAMASARARERLWLERNLGILGTLGNNAPFIGLFGTVLGIIRAFADLAKNEGGGAAAVMSGMSEALVATAMGLLVAIPAVVAFNIFQSKVRRILGGIDAMAHLILSAAPGSQTGSDAGSSDAGSAK